MRFLERFLHTDYLTLLCFALIPSKPKAIRLRDRKRRSGASKLFFICVLRWEEKVGSGHCEEERDTDRTLELASKRCKKGWRICLHLWSQLKWPNWQILVFGGSLSVRPVRVTWLGWSVVLCSLPQSSWTRNTEGSQGICVLKTSLGASVTGCLRITAPCNTYHLRSNSFKIQ